MMAQADPELWTPNVVTYSFIKEGKNTLSKQNNLDSVYKKLLRIRQTHKGKLTIVHIGDSHLQADLLTSIVRKGFQSYFGNAGRGLVFPYLLANSNSPPDVVGASNANWESAKIYHKDKKVRAGVSGFGIQTKQKNAFIKVNLREADGTPPEAFNRMVFFLGKDSLAYRLSSEGLKHPIVFNTRPHRDTPSKVVIADGMLTGFELSATLLTDKEAFGFFGVSLEKKDSGGVLYHTIGVNGARYDQYLGDPLFWQQLAALHPDLIIVSLGTNEAQNLHINVEPLMNVCDSFITSVKRIAPNAAIVLSTPAVSYYKNEKPNPALDPIATAVLNVCEENEISCWDLYNISGGINGALTWSNNGLMGHDRLHYNKQGYLLQGSLLLNAFAKGYNEYIHTHYPKKQTTTNKRK